MPRDQLLQPIWRPPKYKADTKRFGLMTPVEKIVGHPGGRSKAPSLDIKVPSYATKRIMVFYSPFFYGKISQFTEELRGGG